MNNFYKLLRNFGIALLSVCWTFAFLNFTPFDF